MQYLFCVRYACNACSTGFFLLSLLGLPLHPNAMGDYDSMKIESGFELTMDELVERSEEKTFWLEQSFYFTAVYVMVDDR